MMNNVADYHRRARRWRALLVPAARVREILEIPSRVSTDDVASVEDLREWAQRTARGREARQTLEWIWREMRGESLSFIAADAGLSVKVVVQRISRLRRAFRQERDAQQRKLVATGIVATFVLLCAIAFRADDRGDRRFDALPERDPIVRDRAVRERDDAFARCARHEWQDCLDELDDAAGLAPEIDLDPKVQNVRREAIAALGDRRGSSVEAPAAMKYGCALNRHSTIGGKRSLLRYRCGALPWLHL
ncbi:hypothetical protein LZC95_50040 [Pendulispora brunnea]|uniref:Uncharacterized protein n=2 Tax=Pendulispora brunnea TaxID=2905690 RepID=A0ABZ2K785_9BACT